MSKLATQLPSPDELTERIRRGPNGACDIYGDGDLDDCRAVDTLRRGTSWIQAQREVDKALKLPTTIDNDKFRYHWNRRCWHWTVEQKNADL